MKEVTRYVSFDGVEHKTVEECRAHEAGQSHLMLVGLSAEDIIAAMDRSHQGHKADLAAAIEHVGVAIMRERIKAGELKRRRSKKEDAPPAQSAPEPEEEFA